MRKRPARPRVWLDRRAATDFGRDFSIRIEQGALIGKRSEGGSAVGWKPTSGRSMKPVSTSAERVRGGIGWWLSRRPRAGGGWEPVSGAG